MLSRSLQPVLLSIAKEPSRRASVHLRPHSRKSAAWTAPRVDAEPPPPVTVDRPQSPRHGGTSVKRRRRTPCGSHGGPLAARSSGVGLTSREPAIRSFECGLRLRGHTLRVVPYLLAVVVSRDTRPAGLAGAMSSGGTGMSARGPDRGEPRLARHPRCPTRASLFTASRVPRPRPSWSHQGHDPSSRRLASPISSPLSGQRYTVTARPVSPPSSLRARAGTAKVPRSAR